MRLLTSGASAGLVLSAAIAAAQPAPAVTFTDVTQAAGLKFRHTNGAFGKKYLPETMGAGGAFLDYDGDGWQDILLVNSKGWPGQKAARPTAILARAWGKSNSWNDDRQETGDWRLEAGDRRARFRVSRLASW